VTVVDLSGQLPGPYATLLLRSLGARVIKVERPAGDQAREIDGPMFSRVNAGKEFVCLDLKTEAGAAALHALVRAADVFVEGFRPGVSARLGCDWKTLRGVNPSLIYCSLSGFGSTGPLAQHAGHDLNFLGVAAGTGSEVLDGHTYLRIPFVDLGAGTNLALSIVAALFHRRAGGPGCHLDMALLDAAVAWSVVKAPVNGESEPAYGMFVTSDARRLAVSVIESEMWLRLCEALRWDDWYADDALAHASGRRTMGVRITQRLERALAERTCSEVLQLADRHDLAITVVNEMEDLATDPQVATRGIISDGPAWAPLGSLAAELAYAVDCEVGSDTRLVFESLGLSDEQIQEWAREGAFASLPV
jgi:crotonobetainyl-CoA:carnitine CoA-transferase CaiB-like acyl-CoA transferase